MEPADHAEAQLQTWPQGKRRVEEEDATENAKSETRKGKARERSPRVEIFPGKHLDLLEEIQHMCNLGSLGKTVEFLTNLAEKSGTLNQLEEDFRNSMVSISGKLGTKKCLNNAHQHQDDPQKQQMQEETATDAMYENQELLQASNQKFTLASSSQPVKSRYNENFNFPNLHEGIGTSQLPNELQNFGKFQARLGNSHLPNEVQNCGILHASTVTYHWNLNVGAHWNLNVGAGTSGLSNVLQNSGNLHATTGTSHLANDLQNFGNVHAATGTSHLRNEFQTFVPNSSFQSSSESEGFHRYFTSDASELQRFVPHAASQSSELLNFYPNPNFQRWQLQSSLPDPIYQASELQNFHLGPTVHPSNLQSFHRKPTFNPSKLQNFHSGPGFGPSNLQNIHTNPTLEPSKLQKFHTNSAFEPWNHRYFHIDPNFSSTNLRKFSTEYDQNYPGNYNFEPVHGNLMFNRQKEEMFHSLISNFHPQVQRGYYVGDLNCGKNWNVPANMQEMEAAGVSDQKAIEEPGFYGPSYLINNQTSCLETLPDARPTFNRNNNLQ